MEGLDPKGEGDEARAVNIEMDGEIVVKVKMPSSQGRRRIGEPKNRRIEEAQKGQSGKERWVGWPVRTTSTRVWRV